MAQRKVKVKPEPRNLRKLCWLAGYHGVAGFAAAIGRSRVTVHRAAHNPSRFGPTYRLMEDLLAR